MATDKLPHIVLPGQPLARVSAAAAAETGLKAGTCIVAGATDGYTSMLASGSARPGDWTSIIGTTLVLKGVTEKLPVDPLGRVYSHIHPQGWWLPGGAGNCGGLALNAAFPPERFEEMNAKAAGIGPTGALIYPLAMKGERFPFIDPEAEMFVVGDVADPLRHFFAIMEGVGYAERLSFDLMTSLGCEIGDAVFSAGGACRSDPWLQARASILGKRISVPVSIDAAMGSTMLAAAGAANRLLAEVVAEMTVIGKVVDPDPAAALVYDELYGRFREECARRFAMS